MQVHRVVTQTMQEMKEEQDSEEEMI